MSSQDSRRKNCRFCSDKEVILDYKNCQVLNYFVTERGKVIPARITGNCAFHQRQLTSEVKRARLIALMPFTTHHE